MTTSKFRLYTGTLVCALLLLAAPARAQFQPRDIDDRNPAEAYTVQGSIGLWLPSADIIVSSGGGGALTGIVGTSIDAKADLGLNDSHFPEFHFDLRPGRRHTFRFQYIPIGYEATSTLKRDIVFNGQRYQVGIPTASTLDWKAYRFGYQFDVVSASRGSAGVIFDLKYTDVSVTLKSPILNEFDRARAPIPALGGVGRFYVTENASVTGEMSMFKFPDTLFKDTGGHYYDLNIYGTFNVNRYLAVQGGYRSFDVGYAIKTDSGALTLKGLFFGVVARY
jgi:hypothetical protein